MNDNGHEIVDRWITHLEKQGKSPLTREAYINALNRFTGWLKIYSDEFDPQEVIARDIREWKSYQQTTEKASPNKHSLSLISNFLALKHCPPGFQVLPKHAILPMHRKGRC